jgi:hypothetical protein
MGHTARRAVAVHRYRIHSWRIATRDLGDNESRRLTMHSIALI